MNKMKEIPHKVFMYTFLYAFAQSPQTTNMRTIGAEGALTHASGFPAREGQGKGIHHSAAVRRFFSPTSILCLLIPLGSWEGTRTLLPLFYSPTFFLLLLNSSLVSFSSSPSFPIHFFHAVLAGFQSVYNSKEPQI